MSWGGTWGLVPGSLQFLWVLRAVDRARRDDAVVCYVDESYGHLLEEEVSKRKHCMSVDGNRWSVAMPWTGRACEGQGIWAGLMRRWVMRGMAQGSGFRLQGSGFRRQGSGFRLQASDFRSQGAGFRI